tara:strand:- start:75947 stop:76966 length:1020 start_codon:yes stop_codon:yes gene_type:complete
MNPTQLHEIQSLRAIASISVLFGHAQNEARHIAQVGYNFEKISFPWNWGVDLFFVISGFIMVYTSTRLFGQQGAAKKFLTRRFIRIVPLYWFFTSLAVVVLLVLPSAADTTKLAWSHTAYSYLFLPATAPSSQIAPTLDLGWTLNYEMYFYVLFAAFLFLPMRWAVTGLTIFLGGTIAIAALVDIQLTALLFWFKPIVLEFALGMLLGLAYLKNLRTNWTTNLIIGAIGVALLAADLNQTRLIAYGIPACMIFYAIVFSSNRISHPKWLSSLGDSSYTLYLSHPFALGSCALIWKWLEPDASLFIFAVLASVVAIVSAHIFYLVAEAPAMRLLKSKLAA